MDNDRPNPTFQLSVWRPARHNRLVFYFPESPGEQTSFEYNNLHEQVYSWDPGQDDVFSCLDQDLSLKLHKMFMESFAPHLPPAERDIQHFGVIINSLKLELQNPDNSKWADSVQVADLSPNGSANLRINTALSVLNHLYWLFKVFEHVPGASMVIR